MAKKAEVVEPNRDSIHNALLRYIRDDVSRYLYTECKDGKNQPVDPKKSYPFVPFDPQKFLELMEVAYRVCEPRPPCYYIRPESKLTRKKIKERISWLRDDCRIIRRPGESVEGRYEAGTKRFLDAGCGPGFLVKLAECIGFSAEGLENNAFHVDSGRARGRTIHLGDMNTFDCRNYSVVYSYVPLLGELWATFTERVSREADVGAVFVTATDWKLPKEGKYEMIFSQSSGPTLWGQVIKKVAA